VVWQFSKLRNKNWFISNFNSRFKILPIWTFFAPNPGMFDIHVVYRDVDDLSNLSEWKEVNIVSERKFLHILWNPEKRFTKLIVDAVSYIKSSNGSADIQFTKGYLVLLNIVSNKENLLEKPIARQFSIIQSCYFNGGKKEIFPIYRSAFHEL